jgi:hypothetical protein
MQASARNVPTFASAQPELQPLAIHIATEVLPVPQAISNCPRSVCLKPLTVPLIASLTCGKDRPGWTWDARKAEARG